MPEDDFFQGRPLARAKAQRAGIPARPIAPPAPPAPPAAAPPPPAPASRPAAPALPPEAAGKVVDVGAKPVVAREATAEGFLRLQPATLATLANGRNPKGDPFPVARVAGILAAKKTPDLVPLCHPVPLTAIEVDLTQEVGGVRARATVRAHWKTGVEMEALAAVTAALLTVWDMTKALEKDDTGNYPDTRIEDVRVVRKTKEA